MKVFYTCSFLVLLFAACQAGPLTRIRSMVSAAVDTGKNITGGMVENLGMYGGNGINFMQETIKNIRSRVDEQLKKRLQGVASKAQNKIQYGGNGINFMQETIKNIRRRVDEQLKKHLQGVASKAQNKIQHFPGEYPWWFPRNRPQKLSITLKRTSINQFLVSLFSPVLAAIYHMISHVRLVGSLQLGFVGAVTILKSKEIRKELKNLKPSLLNINEDIAYDSQDALQNFSEKVIEKIESLINGTKDVEGKLAEKKKELIEGSTKEINAIVNSTIEKIKAAGSNAFQLINILDHFTNSVNKHIDKVLEDVMDVAKEGAKEITDISDIRKEIGSMVQETINLFGELGKNIRDVLDNIFNIPAS